MFAAAEDFQLTTVTVRTKTGSGANGDIFGASVDRDVFLEDSRKLVRDATGEQVVSETTLYADVADAAVFTPDSKVALPGRTARVLLAKRHVIGDPDVDHLEVTLT
ncbi:hypothetical protein [Intrasporangium flavum]|uniref:hypothetical protein n=1 Tax=Intrasporangium flavum TaxID=1428657 RepID=UPI00096FBFC1|nr:hypothetical protein [Intrasporangium flavum]